ncbi:MAG: NAD(P)-dependent oxidoreductase [Phaeodactylibacter sp.]|nr:NAD(P)-dependent oxidoreductase [Phaeodactylibacter sp.]MCB9049014.1 NAD(P)-dependent oxidoreductase [Lewinellaceae bacterium]
MAEYTAPTTEKDLENRFGQIKPYMNPTMAYYESSRCLFCYDAPCVKACPTSIDIPLFIRQIHTGNLDGAARTIYDSNYFGNICGKVCPTEVLCEGACVYNLQEVKPIEIGRLQSFATSRAIERNRKLYEPAPPNGHKVAVIGAGPASISCACELRMRGYEVDIFEARNHPSGLALYGCAPYKVTNNDVLGEINYLQEQFQFKIHYNHPIESKEQIAALERDYGAILLGVGLGHTQPLNIEGEKLDNCIGATEFIEQVKLVPLSVEVGRRVIVIGGGNTAMDAASESARLGAEAVTLAYRRSKEEMKAYAFEYDLARSAGVMGLFNAAPLAILGTEKVQGVRFIKTHSEGGKVMPLPGSEFEVACDMVILATGQSKRSDFLGLIDSLEKDARGCIKVHPGSFQTSHPKYFAAGDAVNGGAEVVNAAAEGKMAARGIDSFISNSK